MTGRFGFTLLEVLIALIIAGLAAAALLNAAGSGLLVTKTASMYDQAVVRAKSHLAAATYGTKLASGDWTGDDGGGFRWRLHVARLASAALPSTGAQAAGAQQAAPGQVVLYGITVWVGWSDGGTGRQVRLDTEQVGGAG
jgi:general secretion pathway protein I